MEIPFNGRQKEIAQITTAYDTLGNKKKERTIDTFVVTGAPLVGKSALAHEAARQIAERPQDPHSFVRPAHMVVFDARRLRLLAEGEGIEPFLKQVALQIGEDELFRKQFRRGTLDLVSQEWAFTGDEAANWALMNGLAEQMRRISSMNPLIMIFDNHESVPEGADAFLEDVLMRPLAVDSGSRSLRIITTRLPRQRMWQYEVKSKTEVIRLGQWSSLEAHEALETVPLEQQRRLFLLTDRSPGLIHAVLEKLDRVDQLRLEGLSEQGAAAVALGTLLKESGIESVYGNEMEEFFYPLLFARAASPSLVASLELNSHSPSGGQIRRNERFHQLPGVFVFDDTSREMSVHPHVRDVLVRTLKVLSPDKITTAIVRAVEGYKQVLQESYWSTEVRMHFWEDILYLYNQRHIHTGAPLDIEAWEGEVKAALVSRYSGYTSADTNLRTQLNNELNQKLAEARERVLRVSKEQ